MPDHVIDGAGDFINEEIHSNILDSTGSSNDDSIKENVEDYFFELLNEMEMVSKFRRFQPTKIKVAQIVLSREILRVWNLIHNHRVNESTSFDEKCGCTKRTQ
ncbi:hypothetical protein DICVIV_04426 [Dictyocaulus viviparus]|uniref:Uncharacterized protein n=1 Tax=Dictyocaulus viviparus TaxID=29172 RepID=A0A0D8Y4B6_DICVI|nr:hypothetical protein DICVIV_04426 [Dictyocaulus viviparus]